MSSEEDSDAPNLATSPADTPPKIAGLEHAPGFERIQNVTKRDVSKVLSLARSIHLFTIEEVDLIDWILKSYLRQDRKWYEFLCYKEGNNVCGFASFAPAAITTGTFEILWMAVAPTHQGQGVGGTLLKFIEHQLERKNARLINIETSSQKSYAQTRKFYEKHGYKRVAFIRDYYRPGDGKVVYAKYLEVPVTFVPMPAQSLVVPA